MLLLEYREVREMLLFFKKSITRVTAIIVAVLLILPLSINNITINADDSDVIEVQCGENAFLKFNKQSKVVTVSGSGDMYDFRTEFAETVFYEDAQKLIIEDGITSISKDCFADCSELLDISFSNTISLIRNNAFANCSKIKELYFPASINLIRAGTFNGCTGLESVTFDDATFDCSLDGGVFANCTNLKNLNLCDNIGIGGSDNFRNCSSLEEIVIPRKTNLLTNRCFAGCTSLKRIDLTGCVLGVGYATFENCTSLEEVILPSSIIELKSNLFKNCISLKTINIPDKVEIIDMWTFQGCTSLESISFPTSVKRVRGEAFEGCTNLKKIQFGDNNIDVKRGAFKNCSSIELLSFENNEINIERDAFEGCNPIDHIYFTDDNIDNYNFSRIPIDINSTMHCYLGSSAYMYAKDIGCNISIIDNAILPKGIELNKEDVEDCSQYRESENGDIDLESKDADNYVFTSSKDVCKYLAIRMKKRYASIFIYAKGEAAKFLGNNSIDDIILSNYMFEVCSLDPYGADYLKASLDDCDITVDMNPDESGVELTWKAVINYKTTIFQEQVVRKYINDLVKQNNLLSNAMSPLNKLNKIYRLISEGVAYDYLAEDKQIKNYSTSAYGAIVYNKAVAYGYAQYMYALCKKAGIPIRIVSSKSHVWNLVSIDRGKTYYNIDVTYDAKIHGLSDDYYLKSDEDIKKGGSIRDRVGIFNTKEFKTKYPVPEKSYFKYESAGEKGHYVYTVLTNKKISNVVEKHIFKDNYCVYCKYHKKIRLKQTTIKRIKRKRSAKKITITLKKVQGAIGYQVKILKKKKGKVLVSKYVKKTKFSIKSKKFKGKKKLYVKARAYILDEKIKVFGAWSKVKVSKIK